MSSTFCTLIFLFAGLACSLACKCALSPNEERFCYADYAVKARVEKINKVPTTDPVPHDLYEYTVSTSGKFKGEEEWNSLEKVNTVYSPVESATCGVSLTLNSEYFLSGSIRNGTAWVRRCGWYGLWNDVTDKDKKGVESGTFEKACSKSANAISPYYALLFFSLLLGVKYLS